MQASPPFRLSSARPLTLKVAGLLAVICWAFVGIQASAQSARFNGEDRITKGNWKGAYGKDGNFIGSYSASAPSYGSVARSGEDYAVWAAGDDLRGLQDPVGTGRVAPHWSASGSLNVDFAATDTNRHLISIYCLDWDGLGRSEKIEVLNSSTNELLDSRSVASFKGGVYLMWEVTGSVRFRISNAGGVNAVISGIFFDPVGLPRTAHRNLYEVPYFRSEPLPPEYQGKSVKELGALSTNNTSIPSVVMADYKWTPTKRIWTSENVNSGQESTVMAVTEVGNGNLRVINKGATVFSVQIKISNNGTSWSNYLSLISVSPNTSQIVAIGNPVATSLKLVAGSGSGNASVLILRNYSNSAPEFRPHSDLNNFVIDMGSDPMALAAFVQNEIALVDAIRTADRLGDLSGPQPSAKPTPPPAAANAIVAGEMRRNAYTTYLQRRGSPYEQCNLLVYLLREAGYSAALVNPAGTKVEMLSKRLSNMLRLQLKGFLTMGDDERAEVDYPWVVFYDPETSQWRHLFPWIKDTVVEEGFDLYDFLPAKYNTGAKWLDAYLKNDPAVNLFQADDGSDTPSTMFKNFVEKEVAGYGLSIKDVGARIYDRKTVFSSWSDFPVPFSVKPDVEGVALVLKKDWQDLPELYSYVRVGIFDNDGKEIVSTNRHSASMPVGTPLPSIWQRAMELNGRSIYVTGTQLLPDRMLGGYQYAKLGIYMTIGPFDSIYGTATTALDGELTNGAGFPDASINGGVLKYNRILTQLQSSLGSTERMYPISATYNQAVATGDVFNMNGISAKVEWRGSSFTGDPIVPVSERPIRRQDISGVNLNFGSVTMGDLEKLRREAGELADRWDRLGAITHLAGQAYFERVDRLGKELQLLHKCQADVVGFGVTVLKTDWENVEAPRIDMPMYTFPYWNNSLRPDQQQSRIEVLRDFSSILAAELSAQEHSVINDFYHQKDAISAVKLLRIANRDREIVRSGETLGSGPGGDAGLVYPNGFYELTSGEFIAKYNAAEAATTGAAPGASAGVISDLKGVFTRFDSGGNLGYVGTSPNKVPLSNRPAFGKIWTGRPTSTDFNDAFGSNSADVLSNYKTGEGWAKLKGWCDLNGEGKLYVTPGPVKGDDNLVKPSYIGWGSLMVGLGGNLAGWIDGNQAVYNGGFGASFSSGYSSAFNSANFQNLSISSFGNGYFLTSPNIASFNTINPTWEGMSAWSTPYNLSPITSISSASFQGAFSEGFGSSTSGWAGVMNDGYFGDAQFHRGWETSPNYVEDPVNAVNGEFYADEVDLTLPGPLSMELRRNYSSQSEANSILGPGWKLSLMPYLSVAGKDPGDEGYDAVEHANKPKGYLIYAADLDGSVLAFRDQGTRISTTATWSSGTNTLKVDNVTGIVVGQFAGSGGLPPYARVTAINSASKVVTLNVAATDTKYNAPVIFGGVGPWKIDAADNPGLKNFNGKEYEETRNPFNDKIERSGDTYTWYKADGSRMVYTVGGFPIKVKQDDSSASLKDYDRRMPYLTNFYDSVGNFFEFSFYTQSNAAAGVGVELQNAEIGYGQLKRIKSSNGNFMLFSYDTQQRVKEVATNDGRRVQYRYDPLGDLVEAELPDGAIYSYEYQHELAPRPDSRVESTNSGDEWGTSASTGNSGTRIKGWLQPKVTGNYKFQMTGSGYVKLLVSTGQVVPPSTLGDSEAPSSLTAALTAFNTVASYYLEAGHSYYIETRNCNAGSALALQWQKPGDPTSTWTTVKKADLKPYKPDISVADAAPKKIMVEVYNNLSPVSLDAMEKMVNFTGLPYSRNLMIKLRDPEGRLTINEYDKAFRPEHPIFGDYKYRRVTKQWSTSGSDMVPIPTAEFQYSPVGDAWLSTGDNFEVSYIIDKTRPEIGDQITTYVHKKGCLRYVAQPLASGFTPSHRDIPYVAAYDWEEVADGPRTVRRLTGSRDLRKLQTLLTYDGPSGTLRSTKTQGEITGETAIDEATTTYFYNADKHVIKTILPSPLAGDSGRTQVVFATYPVVTDAIRDADTSTGRGDDYLYRHKPTKVSKYVVNSPDRSSAAEPFTADKFEETKSTYIEQVDGTGSFANGLVAATVKTQVTNGAGVIKEQIAVTYGAKGYPTGKAIQTFSTDATVTESYVYDARGLMIANTGPAGRVKRMGYDPRGRPILDESYTSGGATKPSIWDYSYYNQMGELIWKDGPRYNPEDYQFFDYDGAGRKIVEVVWNSRANADNSGVEADTYSIVNHYYDGFGNMIKSVDPRGNYSLMTYDVMGRALTSKSYAADNTLLSQQSSTYEPGGEVLDQTDALGGVTSTAYTLNGKPTSVTKPDHSTEKWTYFLDGRVKTHTLANQSVWDFTYDDLLLKETRALTLGGTLLAKVITTKDIRGKVVREETFADAGTSFVTTKDYDGLGRVIRETGPPAFTAGGNLISAQQEKTYSYSFNTTTHTDITTVTEGGGSRVTVVTTDDLGREASTVVKDSLNNVLESMSTEYDPTHHFVRKFKGSDAKVKADQYLYTDTSGRPILTKFSDGDAGWKYQKIVYDTAGNAIRATDEEGKTTSNDYDGLNRIKQKLYPDGALVKFDYDGAGHLKTREMPGGLTWHAAYTTAGQLDHEYLQQGVGGISRYVGYSYYPADSAWVGLLESIDERGANAGTQVRQHDFLYDTRRRPSSKTSTSGADLAVTLNTTYDFLDRVTSSIRSSAVAGGGTVETKVDSAYDGYGQLFLETVSVGNTVQSQLGQRWDSLGMRTGLAAGSDAPAIGNASWARDFGFSYYSNGRLKGISTQANQYRTSYEYADNGLVTTASLFDGSQKLKEVLTPLATAYDARGRSIGRTTSAAGGQILAETVGRRGDSRAQTYGITRGSGAGGSWANAAESRSYTYDDRGKLKSESYLKNPSAPTAGCVTETLNYGFDAGKLGVLTSVTKSGGVPVWGATLDHFDRAGGQSSNPALRTFEVKGTAHGPGQFALYVAPGHDVTDEAEYAKKAAIFPAPRGSSTPGTPNADWVYPVSLAPGDYSMQARAHLADYPARPFEAKSDHVNITVQGGAINYVLTHDASGRVTRRSWGDGHFVQDIIWSADGHIARVTLTDTSTAGNSGYVWDALYDTQGRRIRTSWLPSGAGAAARVTNSWFDPEIEFLEIAVEYAGKRQWKIHGPDITGEYGGAQGIGGCEAVIDEGSAQISPVINDFFGNTVAHVETGGTSTTADDQIIWHEAQMSGYGVLPDFAVAGLEHTGDLLSAMNWQGRRLDPTGFYDMGTRFYDPEGRKFLSPDPLGHAASMDLYNYANGDPINYIDPDGRLARMIGGAISSVFEFVGAANGALLEMSNFVGGSAMDFLSGRGISNMGPSLEGVREWQSVLTAVQYSIIPLAFVGGPVSIVTMGISSFVSLGQGDLLGAAMGGLGAVGEIGTALRGETAVMSAFSNAEAASSGSVGRSFAGNAAQPFETAASRQLGSTATETAAKTTANANRIMGERAVDDFIAHAQTNGMEVVGREVTFRTPFGNRRLDVVLRNLETGQVGGVEIKSTMGAFNRFDRAARQQFSADRWINTHGADAVGQFEGLRIDNTLKMLWDAPK